MRILGIRLSVILTALIGLIMLAGVSFSDHDMATIWPVQIAKDVAVSVIGLVLFYASHLCFSHIRLHELKKNPEKYSNKHVAIACAMLLSCALIISSALQSAV